MEANQFPIEHDIPIPDQTSGRQSKYPLREMAIGDSFFVPCKGHEISKVQASIRSASRNVNESRKFITRRVEGRKAGQEFYEGVRCWRVQ